MLGRKTYTQEELDDARSAIEEQLAAYETLANAIGDNRDARAALAAFEPLFSNNLILALDRRFVHRLRTVTGKDANPLNEVELLSDSVMNHGAVLRGNTVIKLVPEQTVLELEPGDRIALTAEQFAQLSQAFFGDLEAKFL